jgi:hypothetical protein
MMKTAILASLLASASAFAPASQSGRFNVVIASTMIGSME